jgi:hypothetical protein
MASGVPEITFWNGKAHRFLGDVAATSNSSGSILVAGFSVGVFYFPVAVLMLFAAFRRSPLPEDPPPAPMSDDEFWSQRL